MEGANAARKDYTSDKISETKLTNTQQFVTSFTVKAMTTEILVNYEPSLQYFSEWWKQLAGESEGKDQKRYLPQLQPTSQLDLHSLGQFIQEGTRIMFETVVRVDKPRKNVIIPTWKKTLTDLVTFKEKTLTL